MSAYPKWLRDAASKGGKATGDAKRRGDSAHYKRLSRKAAKARKAKSPNRKAHRLAGRNLNLKPKLYGH